MRRETSIKISFILPCYNVERYITDCLLSIYSQGFPEKEYEVICVNDCSTDKTREVIKEFAESHQNLLLINHEKNLTAGGARNTGIANAHGKYIWFVDPDDMVVPDMVAKVFLKASENDLDVLFFNNDVINESGVFVSSQIVFNDSEVLSGQEYIVKYFSKKVFNLCIVWRCLFKTDFLRYHNLSFPCIRKSQDVVFLWEALCFSSRVMSVKEVAYHYRQNPFSVAKKTTEAKVLFSERILFASEVTAFLNKHRNQIKPQILNEFEKVVYWGANSFLDGFSKMTNSEQAKFYDEIKKHRRAIRLLSPYVNRKYRFLYSTCGGRFLWEKKLQFFINRMDN